MNAKEGRGASLSLFHILITLLLCIILSMLIWHISFQKTTSHKISEDIARVQETLKVTPPTIAPLQETMPAENALPVAPSDPSTHVPHGAPTASSIKSMLSSWLEIAHLQNIGQPFYIELSHFVEIAKTMGLDLHVQADLLTLSQERIKSIAHLNQDLDVIEKAFMERLSQRYASAPNALDIVVKDKHKILEDPDYREFSILRDAFRSGNYGLEGFESLSIKFDDFLRPWIMDAQKWVAMKIHFDTFKNQFIEAKQHS